MLRTDVQSNPQLIIETDYPVTAPMPESVQSSQNFAIIRQTQVPVKMSSSLIF